MADLLLLGLAPALCREVSSSLGLHFEGLGAAARHLHRSKVIDSQLKRRLLEVEVAFNLTRHVSTVSCEALATRLRQALGTGGVMDEQPLPHATVDGKAGFSAGGCQDAAPCGEKRSTPQTGGTGVAGSESARTKVGFQRAASGADRTPQTVFVCTVNAGAEAGLVDSRTGVSASGSEGTTVVGDKAGGETDDADAATAVDDVVMGLNVNKQDLEAAALPEGIKRRRWTDNPSLKPGVPVSVVDGSCAGQLGVVLKAAASEEGLAYWAVQLAGGKIREFPEEYLSLGCATCRWQNRGDSRWVLGSGKAGCSWLSTTGGT